MMRSLTGKTILVTRPRHQAGPLAESLEMLGAKVHLMPAIEIAPLADTAKLDMSLGSLASFDWVVFTSVNGVESVKARMVALGIARDELSARRIAAIGPATAKSIEQAFRAPDLVPEEYVSEAIAEAFLSLNPEYATPNASDGTRNPEPRTQRNLRFLLLRADLARPDLADKLRSMGNEVEEVAAYHIIRANPSALPAQAPDAITLTSAENARATFDLLKDAGREDWLHNAKLICIGPITAEAVRMQGCEPAAVAGEYTADGLLKAIVETIGMEAAHA